MADDHRDSRNDAAAAVRNRRASTPKQTRPQAVLGGGDTTPESAPVSTPAGSAALSRQLEVSADPASPAHTLTGSWIAGHTTSADYAPAKDDAYYSWYPEGCQQPSCRKLWNRGQHVLRSVYARYGGDDAPNTPETAMPVNEPGGGLLSDARGTQSLGAGV